MNVEDVVKKENLWIGNGINGGFVASFSMIQKGQYCSLDCSIEYDIEEKRWVYHFAEHEIYEKEGFENAKDRMIALIKQEANFA